MRAHPADISEEIDGKTCQVSVVSFDSKYTPEGAAAGANALALKMREDVITDGSKTDAILSNAPERIGDFFAVPKVVE